MSTGFVKSDHFVLHLQQTYAPNLSRIGWEILSESGTYINWHMPCIYIFKVLNEPKKNVFVWVKIGAYFTLPRLGAVVRAAAIAQFFPKEIL